jgi:aldose 1-epimerase
LKKGGWGDLKINSRKGFLVKPLNDPAACRLQAGGLEAVFWPGRGMLGASLRHQGVELLGRVDDLKAAAAHGSTAGIPLLHPWANRLAASHYSAAGREVALDPNSRLLHFDAHGLPIHGVPWPHLTWQVLETGSDKLSARLTWTREDLLTVFPFPHCLDMTATLRPGDLTLETILTAGPETPVPVSFGFHPYLVLPGLPRGRWRLNLPPMLRLVANERGIPTDAKEPVPGFDAALGDQDFDDGFAGLEDGAKFSLAGAGRRLTVEWLAGYRFAQVYAPADHDFIAFEPMTAPTSALTTGHDLILIEPGATFKAAFCIHIEALP